MNAKFLSLLALVVFLAACAGNSNEAQDGAQAEATGETIKPRPSNPAIKTMTGELEAKYQNAMLSSEALTINYLSLEGDSLQAVVAFIPEKRECRVPADYTAPVPGQEGAIMPNPETSNKPVMLVLVDGKVKEVKYK
jgi:hypothetical protein